MTSPYDNISNQCYHCFYMSFRGCAHPFEDLQVQDKGVEECRFFSGGERMEVKHDRT